MFKIELEEGKYTFINDNGVVSILRHGEQWRNESGDKAILCLLQKVEQLQEELNIFAEAIGEVEYAMHKVGWNNSRIETAIDKMNERLSELKTR